VRLSEEFKQTNRGGRSWEEEGLGVNIRSSYLKDARQFIKVRNRGEVDISLKSFYQTPPDYVERTKTKNNE